MKTGLTILAGLLVGVLVAAGVLAAFVFVGPDPVGLRPTAAPTQVPSSVAPSPSVVASPSVAPSPSVVASPSVAPSSSPASSGPSASAAASSGRGGPGGSPAGRAYPDAAFHIGQPAPALVVPQLGGGTIDLANSAARPSG